MDERRRRFEHMVEAHSGDIYRYAYLLCRHRPTAEELVQETFLRAWRSFDKLRDRRKARSWLFTVVRREHARLYERARIPVVDDYPLDLVPSEGLENAEVLALRHAVMELPQILREALLLQVLGGLTGNEISEALDVPRATVNTRLFRAREQLRRALESVEDAARAGGAS